MKYWLLGFVVCLLVGCNKIDSHYYWRNPSKLKQAMSSCPNKQPAGVTCDELTVIANKFSYLAAALKQNPQLFGLHIIAMQQNISEQEKQLTKKHDDKLAMDLKQDKQTLAEYLAVVSYYESPIGVRDEDSGQ
ncbi:hypothetical protein [Legionella sp. W05-934-2]|jgi:hypothetical protein|uniref:hypothetical protein n=1 Tax=Legionella sp. W05-934-2 TaxID=1198649 RepID=UPI003461F4C0